MQVQEINNFYQKVAFFGDSYTNPNLSGMILRDKIFVPVSANERMKKELSVVPVGESDFLVEREWIDRGNGVLMETKRKTLGFTVDLRVRSLFLGVKAYGTYLPVSSNNTYAKQAYEIIESYEFQRRPSALRHALHTLGSTARILFP